VAIISRLTAQKGIDLIKHAANHTKSRGAQFILLGACKDSFADGDEYTPVWPIRAVGVLSGVREVESYSRCMFG
jgi:glycogen synthase